MLSQKTESTELESKGLSEFEIKDAEKGEVQAVVATLGVVDRDEDIIRKGAIPNGARVKVSGYGHDAMFGEPPVGKGALFIEGDKVVFKGQYFLDTTRGRESFNVVKGLGADGEWSFGFRVLGSEVPEEADRAKGARRILTKLEPFEVSPVMVGAGVGTQTISAKEKGAVEAPTQAAAPEKIDPDPVLDARVDRVKRAIGSA
jgi:hypothetical protein